MRQTVDDVIALMNAGDREAALAVARTLSAGDGADDDAAYFEGTLLLELDRPAEALTGLAALVARRPLMNHAALALAQAHDRTGDRAAAIGLLRPIVQRVPGHSCVNSLVVLLTAEAAALMHDDRNAEALPVLREAAACNHTYPEVLRLLGQCLVSLDQHAEAEGVLRAALSLYPDHPTVVINLCIVLEAICKLEEGEALCRRVTGELSPHSPHGWSTLGSILRAQGRMDEARDAFLKALELDPAFFAAITNLGTLASVLNRFTQSDAYYRQALALEPARPLLNFVVACDRLKAGDLERGWEFYEKRGAYKPLWACTRGLPVWPGGDPAGLRIILEGEQGYGDFLQFYRYARLLADRGARVGLLVPPALERLFALSDPRLELLCDGTVIDPAAWDWAVPLMSLPHRFGTRVETIPAAIPYLGFDPAQGREWAARLSALPGRKVGLAWAGDPRPHDPVAAGIDGRRSLRLSALAPLAGIEGISFVSLQKGGPAAQAADSPFPLQDWTDELSDFADTAALTAQLDLVVTVDTAMAHLSGGLGRPVMMLSRFDGCWRWLHDRDDTPWYPTMRLFRQRRWGDWSDPIADLAAALKAWAA